ncbi:MAG: glutathione S-transferase [Paracoccaceae bacterium]|nr:glutathione S-transferase [Paracoccaceae bacterium]
MNVLKIGDYAYSSWSLRGWLLFEQFGIPVRCDTVDFRAADVAEQLQDSAPARTVPTWITGEGAVVWDSLAIAEELADRHPEAGLWPADPASRATARSLAAEMHSGFGALRSDCPMNLRCAYAGFEPSSDVLADLERIETVWRYAMERFGGPWLCGAYSAADVFFAPVAARMAGYGLPVGPEAQAYVDAHLADPAFRRWRAMGLVKGADLPWYARDYAQVPWPGPTPMQAKPIETGTPINTACPYSGKAATHLMEMDGRIYGFCNPFCRDKTVADPGAWPAFMALVD